MDTNDTFPNVNDAGIHDTHRPDWAIYPARPFTVRECKRCDRIVWTASRGVTTDGVAECGRPSERR